MDVVTRGSTQGSVVGFAASTPEANRRVLDELVEGVRGVSAVLVASVDGFAICRSSQAAADPSNAAMLAAAIGLGAQLVGLGGGTAVRQLVIDHDGGLILVRPIGERHVIAVIAARDLDQLQLRAGIHARFRRLTEMTA